MNSSYLESYIRNQLQHKPILLMSHLVLGYPSLAENSQVIEQMATHGVDLMELQLPFSEPSADGPVIAQANQRALENGFKVREGLAFVAQQVKKHALPFLLMTYYNILFAYGAKAFVQEAARIGVHGLIVPDLPLEEADQVMTWCQECQLDWIQLMTPTTPIARLQKLGNVATGFCYCVARKGVTGKKTDFNLTLEAFMQQCRAATPVPLAVGFGVRHRDDVQFLQGKAEIAVVGTASIEIHRTQGVASVGRFFAQLNGAADPAQTA